MKNDPKIIHVEYPGEKFWEQVEVDEEYRYAFYRPPNEILAQESISYDYFQPGEITDDYITRYIPIKKCPWPLSGEPLEPEEYLYDDIRQFIWEHLDLPDDRLYDVMTAWIKAAWIPEAWSVVPYLFFHGPIASGKTRALEVLRALCRRGLMGCNISEAALFRAVEKWKPVAILDETEIYTKEGKSAVQNLLNSGYRLGQVAIRVRDVEHGQPVLDTFDVFGFKALAGTEGFKAALESRSVMINMGKNVRRVNFLVDETRAKELRSRLLLWRWRTLSDLSVINDVFYNDVPSFLGFTDGRLMELFACLVAVADEGREAIISYARSVHEDRIHEDEVSEEAEVLQAILRCRDQIGQGRFAVSGVKAVFNENRGEKEKWGSRGLGRIIKRLGFKQRRMPDSSRGYVWDDNLIQKLCERYRVDPKKTSVTTKTSAETAQQRFVAPRAQEQMDVLLGELSCVEGASIEELAEKLGVPVTRIEKILFLMQRDGSVFQPRVGWWKKT